MTTSIAAESTRLEMFKWLATETDNDLIVEVAAFVKKHTFKKSEEDFFKPMTDEEYYQKVKRAVESADNGRVISTAELRKRAKTWSK